LPIGQAYPHPYPVASSTATSASLASRIATARGSERRESSEGSDNYLPFLPPAELGNPPLQKPSADRPRTPLERLSSSAAAGISAALAASSPALQHYQHQAAGSGTPTETTTTGGKSILLTGGDHFFNRREVDHQYHHQFGGAGYGPDESDHYAEVGGHVPQQRMGSLEHMIRWVQKFNFKNSF
jgi:hypothetical protein